MYSWARSHVSMDRSLGTTNTSGASLAWASEVCSSAERSKLEAQEIAAKARIRVPTARGMEGRTGEILSVPEILFQTKRREPGARRSPYSLEANVPRHGTRRGLMRPLASMARHSAGLLLAAGAACTAGPSWAVDCARDSTGMIPLTDLGSGTYRGFEGGLYAGGSNGRPPSHEEAGLTIANSLAPLDTLGVPDSASGRIVLISIGMSNTTQEFQTFVPKAMADPLKKPGVLVVDCALGGMSADRIRDPGAAYWDSVDVR